MQDKVNLYFYLLCCDAISNSLLHRLSGDLRHNHVRKPIQHLAEQSNQSNLQLRVWEKQHKCWSVQSAVLNKRAWYDIKTSYHNTLTQFSNDVASWLHAKYQQTSNNLMEESMTSLKKRDRQISSVFHYTHLCKRKHDSWFLQQWNRSLLFLRKESKQ